MSSFWSKRIRNKVQVAKDLGVDETKIQELINGERHIGGDTMDKVLESINNEEECHVAKKIAILDWYHNTDLKALRKEFGYSQAELSRLLRINAQTLSAIEEHRNKKVSDKIEKMYNFYQNEFNKKISTTKPITKITEETPVIEIEPNVFTPYVVDVDSTPHKTEYSKNQEYSEGVVIKIDNRGNLRYFENGKEVENVSEIHLEKVGCDKPVLEIKLTRLF